MCFSKPKSPDYAAQARTDDEERKAKIRSGSDSVNSTLDQAYAPTYFSGIGNAYRNYYRPQVEDQARQANRNTAFRYAPRANSSAANRTFGNLALDRSKALTGVESGALGAQSDARQRVEATRGNLLNMVESGANQSSTNLMAVNAANAGIGRPQFSPIGDLFAQYTGQLRTNAAAQDQGYEANPFWKPQVDFLRGGGRGSQRIVGGD